MRVAGTRIGVRYTETPLAEWSDEPRRDEQGDLYLLLMAGEPLCEPTDDWTGFTPSQASERKKVCQHCPVRVACLDYAMTYDVVGVWGGTTAGERVQRRLRLGIKPVPLRAFDD